VGKKLKIAIIAPPWLKLYPGCFYGIENVVQNLSAQLTKMGHHVELFTVKGSTTKVDKIHWYHEKEQYPHLLRPYNEMLSIWIAHLLYSINIIREAGDFDVIHDHSSFVGPAVFAYATGLPPVLHTLHEPFTDEGKLKAGVPDNRLMFEQFKNIKNLYFSAVSETQKSMAPDELLPRIKVIHNGINPDEYPFSDKKEDFFLMVASVSALKGQATAAKLCSELGIKLKMAGTIGGKISTAEDMRRHMADRASPMHDDRNFSYFRDEVAPYLKEGQIEYIGEISGQVKENLFKKAKAFIFPIDWEEPFGIAIIEALASGTPVLAYKRGAMVEIIQHGRNGFLADTYKDLKEYAQKIDEIDPAFCQLSVEEKFSAEVMTEKFVDLYRDIIKRYWRVRARRFVNQRMNPRLPVAQNYKGIPNLLPGPEHRRYIHRNT